MDDRKPEAITNQIQCEIWMYCVHGAGCLLSPFDSEDKKMPLLTIEDGKPVCQDVRRG